MDDVFYRSAHPYTLGLKAAMPSRETSTDVGLMPIEGAPPDLFQAPAGCGYAKRCPHAMALCGPHRPQRFEVDPGHHAMCWLHHAYAPPRVEAVYRGGRT